MYNAFTKIAQQYPTLSEAKAAVCKKN